MIQAKTIYEQLNIKYDFKNQEPWDNCCFTNNSNKAVKKVLVCLDITAVEIKQAIANQANLIISHHPLFTNVEYPSHQISIKLIKLLKKHEISTIFLHTAFDKSIYGMNISLAAFLELKNIQLAKNQQYSYGNLVHALTLKQLAVNVKKHFKLDYAKYIQAYGNKKVQTIAICGGSGSSLVYEKFDVPVDVLITSDIKHHTWMDSLNKGPMLLDVNHTIENIFVDVIAKQISDLDKKITVIPAKNKVQYTIM